MTLELPEVTLCCVDAVNHALALRALTRCRESIHFGRTVFLTNAIPEHVEVPTGIEVVPTAPIASHEAYSRVVLKELYTHVETSHVLLVQWDGYVVHVDRWDPAFLESDYIGAAWPDKEGKPGTVGNGGFSLRSRRLLEVLQDASFPLVTNTEDVTICGVHRSRLQSEFGIRFASTEMAKRFSFEMCAIEVLAEVGETFGFHGIFNLFLVEPAAEIAAIANEFPDAVAKSVGIKLLLKNLSQFGMWGGALAVGQRILDAAPEDEEVAALVVQAREALEQEKAGSSPRESSLMGRLAQRLRRR